MRPSEHNPALVVAAPCPASPSNPLMSPFIYYTSYALPATQGWDRPPNTNGVKA